MKTKALAFSAAMMGSLLALLCDPAVAFVPALDQGEIASIVRNGVWLEEHRRGYEANKNLLFAAANTLRIRKNQSPVEAIIVGTPSERLKYASYLASFQGERFNLDRARSIARQDADVVQFVVFAHSASTQDRQFLKRFGNARLRLGKHAIRSSMSTTFGPALDYYDIDGFGRQFRWLGSVTFRFNLRALRASGVDISKATGAFSFTSSEGEKLQYMINLARYP